MSTAFSSKLYPVILPKKLQDSGRAACGRVPGGPDRQRLRFRTIQTCCRNMNIDMGFVTWYVLGRYIRGAISAWTHTLLGRSESKQLPAGYRGFEASCLPRQQAVAAVVKRGANLNEVQTAQSVPQEYASGGGQLSSVDASEPHCSGVGGPAGPPSPPRPSMWNCIEPRTAAPVPSSPARSAAHGAETSIPRPGSCVLRPASCALDPWSQTLCQAEREALWHCARRTKPASGDAAAQPPLLSRRSDRALREGRRLGANA